MIMDPEKLVTVEFRGHVAIVTIDNPKTRNALSPEMFEGLGDRLEALMGNWDCRAIVLTGANGAFCSGGDVSRMAKDRQILDTRISIGRAHRVMRTIVNGAKPVIAAVDGVAFGAGMSLAIGCDFVVTAANSRFCAAFAKVGLAPDMGLYWTLPQRVGLGMAKRLIMLAPTLTADEALAIGVVDEIAPEGQALARAIAMAEELAGAAPLSVAVTKAVLGGGCLTLEDAFRAERDHHSYLVRSADHLGAVEAFREKRKPDFNGR